MDLGRRCNEGMGKEMGVRASMMEGAWPKVASKEPEAGSTGTRESGTRERASTWEGSGAEGARVDAGVGSTGTEWLPGEDRGKVGAT